MHLYSNTDSVIDEDEIINDLLEIEKLMERFNDGIRYLDEQIEEGIPEQEEDAVPDDAQSGPVLAIVRRASGGSRLTSRFSEGF